MTRAWPKVGTTVWFGGALALLVALIVGQVYVGLRDTEATAARTAANLAGAVGAAVTEDLLRAEREAAVLAQVIPPDALTRPLTARRHRELREMMLRQQTGGEDVFTLRVFDAGGTLVLGPPLAGAVAQSRWFRALKAAPRPRRAIAETAGGGTTGHASVLLAVPILDVGNRFLGAVTAAIDLEHFRQLVDGLDVGANGVICLRRADMAAALLRKPRDAARMAAPLSIGVRARLAAGQMAGHGDALFADGLHRVFAFRRMSGYPLYAVVALAHRDFMGSWLTEVGLGSLAGAVLVLVMGTAFFRLRKSQARLTQANEALRDSEARYRGLFESLPVGVVLHLRDGTIAAANQAASDILKVGRGCLLGQRIDAPDWTAIRQDGSPFGVSDFPAVRAMATGQPERDVLMGLGRDTRTFWLRINSEPLFRPGSPHPHAVISSFRDVTSHIEAHRQADKARLDAERANAAKSHFIAAASHDLRQPLQALRLYLDVLDGRLSDPQNRKVVAAASAAMTGAETLLNALLDMSKFDSGAITAHRRVAPLAGMMERLASDCGAAARDKGLGFSAVPSTAEVDSDPVLLERILRNLLHNAVKYTEQGRILFGARRVAGGVRIEVWDTGVGIPADSVHRIFDDFFQIGNQARDQAKGLGVGLAVVRRMAELLDHRVGVRSQAGCGSVFSVEVPCPAQPKPAAASPDVV